MTLLLSSLLLTYLVVYIGAENTYTTQYDGVDLDEILTNDRMLTAYINCLLDKGPCTPDGKELKKDLPDAIDNDCSKCSEKQKEGSERVMHYIIDHRPDDWNKLEKKYNADGSYKLKYMTKKKNSSENDKKNSVEDEH
ncbi:ejaculatory bulb-specific protein 3-like [Aricia agestis]|uniref:ejaculatory bulb-specific protein 3-like n=1 Tax=Aricia agestis TaxID=91739 RepID=UPI001C202D67|nr:ejaculatory bulb-specific protein 3-like [Aricia agestis]XP_041984819.1 ejaculatory bulb-specific protein 3-like [Aricia agestis]XP_041984820.1 ejaculatory bulb-specific protein 3-like [Aricia agestis]